MSILAMGDCVTAPAPATHLDEHKKDEDDHNDGTHLMIKCNS
jgi:hypothetical protein